MKKLVILLILFLIPSVVALNVTLTQKYVGPGQHIQGTINVPLASGIPPETQLIVHLGSYEKTKPFSSLTAYLPSNTQTHLPSVKTLGSSSPEQTIQFSQAGSQTVTGVNIIQGPLQSNDITHVAAFRFSVAGNGQPENVRIDIGADGTYEYRYLGKPTGQKVVVHQYLPEESDVSTLGIKGTDVVCEQLLLPPSSKYTVKVYYDSEKITMPTVGIFHVPPATQSAAESLCDTSLKNCHKNNAVFPTGSFIYGPEFWSNVKTLVGKSQTYDMRYVSTTDAPHYVCMWMSELTQEDMIKIPVGYTKDIPSYGYYNGLQSKWNFLFDVQAAVTNTKLTEQQIFSATQEMLPYILSLIHMYNGVIPLRITSDSSGTVLVKDLFVSHMSVLSHEVTSFTPLTYIHGGYTSNTSMSIPLEHFGITAPLVKGTYTLDVSLLGDTASAQIIVSDTPQSILTANTFAPFVGQKITLHITENTLTTIIWNVGDGSPQTVSATKEHIYTQPGVYTVTATFTDTTGKQTQLQRDIVVTPATENLPERITGTIGILSLVKAKLQAADPITKSVADALSLQSRLANATTQLLSLQGKINVTGISPSHIYNEYQSLTTDLVVAMSITELIFTPQPVSLSTLPAAYHHEAALAYQSHVTVTGRAYHVLLTTYDGSTEEFVLVMKTVPLGVTVYELIPFPVTEILTKGYAQDTPFYRWDNIQQIHYTYTGLLEDAVKTKTVVIPPEGFVTEEQPEEVSFDAAFACGDDVCSLVENETNCPEDCAPTSYVWIFWVILLLAFISGVVYYFNFYTGPYDFTWLHGLFVKKKPLFASEEDKKALVTFIAKTQKQGLMRQQIVYLLQKRKWTKEQIDTAMKEAWK